MQRVFILSLTIVCALGCGSQGGSPIDSASGDAAKPTAPAVVPSQTEPPMVRIPAGFFVMGSPDLGEAEKPAHRVYLDEYYIGLFEVTNAQYKTFCHATGYSYPVVTWEPDGETTASDLINKPNFPVVGINWEDAVAYCRWLSETTGKQYRLPTEAEWEKAARGGLEGKKYPWGDEAPEAGGRYRANVGSEADNNRLRKRDGFLYTAPVGSFPPNGYGLYDVAGNVWEWCADIYDENYYCYSPEMNPLGPASGQKRVLRGGSWWGGPSRLPCAARLWNYPFIRYASTGFRVAMTP